MDYLGRYYTQDNFSELLVRNLEFDTPKTIVDLGAGGGSLLRAAYNRWKDAEFIAADIDKDSVKYLNKELPFIKVFHTNGLKVNVEKAIRLESEIVDVAICNPPYLLIRDKRKFENLFIEARLAECNNLNKLSSDIVFLAQNIKLLRNNGELGIILPDSVLTGQDFIELRKGILTNHKLKAIIELPDRIFPKTEAKTHIMLVEKNGITSSKVPLYISDKNGKCYDQIDVSSSSLINRMDFSFHKLNFRYDISKKSSRLSDYDFTLKRGFRTHAELKIGKSDFLHSTSFKDGAFLKVSTKKQSNKEKSKIYAQKGDILIVRVGRRCVGKSAIIMSGRIEISDCLYVIRTNKNVSKLVWKFIQSVEGKDWFKANSHGVCAKVLNRNDIHNIPLGKL
jgi:tRNA1(Val) A37 N6-methylase TrmN6